MSQSRQVYTSKTNVSKLAILALSLVFLAGLFVAAFDNGHVVNLAFAQSGVDPMVLHELTHDVRHAAGFPCH